MDWQSFFDFDRYADLAASNRAFGPLFFLRVLHHGYCGEDAFAFSDARLILKAIRPKYPGLTKKPIKQVMLNVFIAILTTSMEIMYQERIHFALGWPEVCMEHRAS